MVWRGGSVGERRGVVTQIITHLLRRLAMYIHTRELEKIVTIPLTSY